MVGWIYEDLAGWLAGWMDFDGWLAGWMDRLLNSTTEGCMNGRMISWVHGWIIRLTLGWSMGWMERWRCYENLD